MKVLGNVLKRIQKLTEQRNDIIHRTWFIGWASAEQEDFSIAPGWKFQSTNRGPEFKPLYYTETEFNGLSREADELTGIVLRIHGCLMLDRRFVDNFDVAADGTVRLPSLESQ